MEGQNKPTKAEISTQDIHKSETAVDPEVVLNKLREPQTLSKINFILSQHGISASSPWLRIDIETTSEQQVLELDEEDIKKLCSSFGPIERVIIQPNMKTTAMVLFKDVVSAYLAQQTLHQLAISLYQARLYVKWCLPEDTPSALPDPVAMQSIFLKKILLESASTMSQIRADQDQNKSPFFYANVYQEPGKINENLPNVKYTCRFDIQIENEKEFQVARKLIGAKGCNMKRILDLCYKSSNVPIQEVVKLRLRGRGSGFKEGPTMQESDEPLHLCISSRYLDKYDLARHLAKELILNVYEDYKRFCERTGKEPIVNLQIKMKEYVTGIRNQRSSLPQMSRAKSATNPSAGSLPQQYYPQQPTLVGQPENAASYYPPGFNSYTFDANSTSKQQYGTGSQPGKQ